MNVCIRTLAFNITRPVFSIVCLIVSAQSYATDWNVDEVLMKLKSEQSDTFVNSVLFEGGWSVYDSLIKQIESGEPKWLEVAELLRQHTDAGASEAIATALGNAIKNNPEAVLAMMSDFEVKWSCSVPLIEPSKQEFINFVDLTLKSMSKVTDENLNTKKSICIEQLNAATQYYKTWEE